MFNIKYRGKVVGYTEGVSMVFNDTTEGKLIQSKINSGMKYSISVRGTGEVGENGYIVYDGGYEYIICKF